mgnify:CR=1 FL=1
MLKSSGWKRAVAIILFIVSESVPQVQPFKPIIEAVASVLGITGIAHAAFESVKKPAE